MATAEQVLQTLKIDYYARVNRLMFCCPFHHDTDPSAGFYEDTQLAHCFSCGYTLDPTAFYAKYQDLNYRRAQQDLERRFGEAKPSKVWVNLAKNAVTRSQAEKAFAGVPKTWDRRDHSLLGEALDKILWRHLRGELNDSRLDKEMKIWYTVLEEALNGPENSGSLRAPRVGALSRLKERVADLPGIGRQDGQVDLD